MIFYLHDNGFFGWWSRHGDPCSLYADDTAIFVENPSQLQRILAVIQFVGTFTGLHLNIEKTIAFSIVKCPEYKVNKPVKYLGAYLGMDDNSDLNFSKPLNKAQNNA